MVVFVWNKGGLSVVTKLFSVSWDFVWNLAAASLGFGRTSMIPFIPLSVSPSLLQPLWFCAYVCCDHPPVSLMEEVQICVRTTSVQYAVWSEVWHNSRVIWAGRLTQYLCDLGSYLSHSLATFHLILSSQFIWAHNPLFVIITERINMSLISVFAQLSINLIEKLHSYLVKHERKQKQQGGLLWLWANKVLG